jgi:hypothetical protein
MSTEGLERQTMSRKKAAIQCHAGKLTGELRTLFGF